MKMKILAQCILSGAALMATCPAIAGLSLSDSPMFVTEALLPNVIITPVFYKGYNEAILKDLPWRTDKATLLAEPWKSSRLTANPYGFRVTPWPITVLSTPSVPNGCVVANNLASYVCSQTSLYSLGGGDIAVTGGTTVNNFPLSYNISNNSYVSAGGYYSQEMYPQRSEDILNDSRYRDEKSRYFHSNSNFLYFDADVADVYEAWPNLGGDYSFTSYGTVADARNAKYSPMAAYAGAGTVALDSFVDNWMPDANGIPLNHKAYVGQYWKKTPDVSILLSNSFVGTCWDVNTETSKFGCTNAMTDAQKTQFANWFTYWRSSDLATRGMLGKLFKRLSDADLLGKFRFAIGKYGGTFTDGFYSVANAPGTTKAEKTVNLLASIGNVIYSPYTGFGQAWQHRSSNAKLATDDAYRDAPGQPLRSCRRNYEVLLTPDYSQLSWAMGNYRANRDLDDLRADQQNGVPFPDNYASTWSDVGAEGWAADLRPDLANNILPGLKDPATHQHVVRYIIGPNAEGGDVFPPGILGYDAALSYAKTATINNQWPNPYLDTRDDFRPTFDDLWHMALNSRGFYYPSNNVSEAATKLLDAFNDVLVRNISGSAVATNTSSLAQGGKIYQATVESDWKGHLRAFSVTPNIANTILQIDYRSELWDLADKVSSQANGDGWGTTRKIATYNGGGVPFRWDDIGATARSLLKTSVPEGVTDSDVYGAKLLEYLRGSGTCEDGSATICASGTSYVFRRRNIDRSKTTPYSTSNPNGRNVLGDIANSNPWLVSPPPSGRSDVDYPNYNAFRVANKSRRNVLYVGANDGMLHAVDVSEGNDRGQELFAYIPSFVQSRLHELASVGYAHRFFVDGSPFSADVDLSGWKTVLAGGANKGGKGYYLLDVTTPDTNTEANAATWVKWEFTHPRDLHYTFNLPVADSRGQARQIALMNDGNLALIVGNGYPEETGKKACLFILYLSGPGVAAGDDAEGVDYHGTGYHKLCAGATSYTSDGGLDTNGLSTPTPLDLDGDGKVDVVYAGDLNGNMWRFNVSSATPANWAVEYPLFVAKNASSPSKRQPIIVPPELTLNTQGATSGTLVLFGTGKYMEDSDRANTEVQSFYGVWDRGLSGITRGKLFEQTFQLDTSNVQFIRKQDTKLVFNYCTATTLSDCTNVSPPPDPNTNTYLGWFWDMPTSGERLTGKMSLINGVIVFNTFFPAIETYVEGGVTKYRLDPCQYGGDGWQMGLNSLYGYMESTFSVFDVNLDGVINGSDVRSAGVKVGAMMGGTTFAKGIGNTYVGVGAATNVSHTGLETPPVSSFGTAGSGRVSWFELLD